MYVNFSVLGSLKIVVLEFFGGWFEAVFQNYLCYLGFLLIEYTAR